MSLNLPERIDIPSPGGYSIPALLRIGDNTRRICLILHGFASSKESSTAQALMERLARAGVGSAVFDMPCHGDSEAPPSALTVDSCVSDLIAVEAECLRRSPGAETEYFASSYGAFVAVSFLTEKNVTGKRVLLRSAALDMDRSMGAATPAMADDFRRLGYTLYDPGFGPRMRLTEEFFTSLARRGLFSRPLPEGTRAVMIHGLRDREVDPWEAARYAESHGVPISMIPGAGHELDSPEALEILWLLAEGLLIR